MFKCGKFLLPLYERTHIMGILNRTPDSFSDDGKFMDEGTALNHLRQMVKAGADIIDIGGQSTRPGSKPISIAEELRRTIPIIEKISDELEIPISIDTSKSEVARQAILKGASIVNDVTGLKSDSVMAGIIADSDAAVCLMHLRGTPETMQNNPWYDDLMHDIIEELRQSINIALDSGIPHERIIIDPGIGFGKTAEHNLVILKKLGMLKILDKPILVGTSRKSFIGKVLDKDIDKRLMGTAASSALAIANGANIIRVHDVAELADTAKMVDAIKRVG